MGGFAIGSTLPFIFVRVFLFLSIWCVDSCNYYYYCFTHCEFSHQLTLLVFHLSLFSYPLLCSVFSPISAMLLSGSVLSAIIITVTRIFHCFFSSWARSKYFSLFVFFDFHSVVHQYSKVHNSAGSHFLCRLSLGLVFLLELNDQFITQNSREFCVSFSRTDSGFFIYHLVVRSNFNFLYNSQYPHLGCYNQVSSIVPYGLLRVSIIVIFW